MLYPRDMVPPYSEYRLVNAKFLGKSTICKAGPQLPHSLHLNHEVLRRITLYHNVCSKTTQHRSMQTPTITLCFSKYRNQLILRGTVKYVEALDMSVDACQNPASFITQRESEVKECHPA
ncbi:hypothetical protein KIN20_019696 [Parelaphostrongylus tenuis]|uniref:Uncharacterized protein n=1 Tax=Parelaphostrongylus tenuis TaxID=148309 RepID=A0AAD5QT15_PARTN|nr:hypothetical protein KIN20_019696 [Parelaphostrongylus tenuis]